MIITIIVRKNYQTITTTPIICRIHYYDDYDGVLRIFLGSTHSVSLLSRLRPTKVVEYCTSTRPNPQSTDNTFIYFINAQICRHKDICNINTILMIIIINPILIITITAFRAPALPNVTQSGALSFARGLSLHISLLFLITLNGNFARLLIHTIIHSVSSPAALPPPPFAPVP